MTEIYVYRNIYVTREVKIKIKPLYTHTHVHRRTRKWLLLYYQKMIFVPCCLCLFFFITKESYFFSSSETIWITNLEIRSYYYRNKVTLKFISRFLIHTGGRSQDIWNGSSGFLRNYWYLSLQSLLFVTPRLVLEFQRHLGIERRE